MGSLFVAIFAKNPKMTNDPWATNVKCDPNFSRYSSYKYWYSIVKQLLMQNTGQSTLLKNTGTCKDRIVEVLCSGVKVYDMNRSSQHFTMLHNITAVCRLHNTHNNILQLTLLLLHAEILENLLRASLHLICANIFYGVTSHTATYLAFSPCAWAQPVGHNNRTQKFNKHTLAAYKPNR